MDVLSNVNSNISGGITLTEGICTGLRYNQGVIDPIEGQSSSNVLDSGTFQAIGPDVGSITQGLERMTCQTSCPERRDI